MTPARILIVEDERVVARDIQNRLTRLGYEVVGSTRSGDEAVRLAGERRPDLVLMDISLPGVEGIETTRALLAQDPATRVLVLTSVSDQERILESIQAGALGYLMKDAEPDELFDRIRLAVGDH